VAGGAKPQLGGLGARHGRRPYRGRCVFGGTELVRNGFGMPLSWLSHTPVHGWALPGALVAGVAVRSFTLAVLIAVADRRALAEGYLAGLALMAWIGIQLLVLQRYFFLQPVIASVGAAELLFAWAWQRVSVSRSARKHKVPPVSCQAEACLGIRLGPACGREIGTWAVRRAGSPGGVSVTALVCCGHLHAISTENALAIHTAVLKWVVGDRGFRSRVTAPARVHRGRCHGCSTRRHRLGGIMDQSYPVKVQARLDEPLSRWLWLVKWLLAIRTTLCCSLVDRVRRRHRHRVLRDLVHRALPRSLFSFNLGVLRWSWRVAYYTYSALGTDRYPPFSLAEEPDYPATLDIAYPERLFPRPGPGQVVAAGDPAVRHRRRIRRRRHLHADRGSGKTWQVDALSGGLIGLLVFFAAITLLFSGRYPRGLYDFVVGMNRWVLRVIAYAALMTDAYPPFRLDQGGPACPPRTR